MDYEKIISNFSGNKIIVSVLTANKIAKSFKLKSDLIEHLNSGNLFKAFSIHGKQVYVDTALKTTDTFVYDEYYSPILK